MIHFKRKLTKFFTLYFFSCFLFLSIRVGAQPYPDFAELRVIGSSATFFFKTMDQFKNGVTLNDWTTIRIRFKCKDNPNWHLLIWTEFDSIQSIDGTTSIPLSNFSVKITSEPTDTINTTIDYHEELSPSSIKTSLIWGSANVDSLITTVSFKISYTISPNGLGSLPSGTFFFPLRLTLEDAP